MTSFPEAESRTPLAFRYPATLVVLATAAVVYAVQSLVAGAVAGATPLDAVRSVAGTPLVFFLLSPFLHASAGHLLWNGAVFALLSPGTERQFGAAGHAGVVLATGWLTNLGPAFLPGGTDVGIGLSGVTYALGAYLLPGLLDAVVQGRGSPARRLAYGALAAFVLLLAVRTLANAVGVLAPLPGTAVQSHLLGLGLGLTLGLAVEPTLAPDE